MNLVTLNPARAVGLTDQGSLEVGMKADVVLLESGRVAATLKSGKIIYWAGHPVLPTQHPRALELA